MSYLSELQQVLTPEQYKAVTTPLMYTANERYGGNVQDFQAQLLMPLDTKNLSFKQQINATPFHMQTVQGAEYGSVDVPVESTVNEVGYTPFYGGQNEYGNYEVAGYRSEKPQYVNGVPVYANYDTSGKLLGYVGDENVKTYINGQTSLVGSWDASGKAKPDVRTASGSGFFSGVISDVMSDPVLATAANAAAAYFGGPLGSGALQLAQGKSLEDAAKAAAVSYTAQQVAPNVTSATGSQVAGQLAGGTSAGLLSGQNLEASLSNAALNTGANQAAGAILNAPNASYTPSTDYSTGANYGLTGNTGGLGLQATPAPLDMNNPYSFDTNYASNGGLGFYANLAPFDASNPYSLSTIFGNLSSMGGGTGIQIPNQEGATLGSIGAQAKDAASSATQNLLGNLIKSALLGSTGTGNMATTTNNTDALSSLLGGLLGGAGNLMQGSTNVAARQAQADALRQAGQQAATASQFRPIGTTTRFGSSNFQVDPTTGQLVSAGYSASPLAQGYQDQLAGMTSQGLMQGQQLQSLANQYLGESPEAVRQRYVEQQTALLAPQQEQQLAGIRNNLFQTGRQGLATGATSAGGLAATNPEMAAYYNSLANQQRQIAAGADQAAQQQIQFGQGLAGTAYQPFTAGFGAQGAVESAAQQPLALSTDLASQFQKAQAQGGAFNLNAQTAAANAMLPANQYNPYASLLGGLGGSTQATQALGGLLGTTGLGQSVGNWLGSLGGISGYTGSPGGLDTSNIDYNYLSQIYSGGNPYAGTTWDGE